MKGRKIEEGAVDSRGMCFLINNQKALHGLRTRTFKHPIFLYNLLVFCRPIPPLFRRCQSYLSLNCLMILEIFSNRCTSVWAVWVA